MYKVKIISPHRKSDVTVRYLHNVHTTFESAIGLCMKLVEEFQELVPDSLSFNVGYFEGQSHAKIWLVAREDFLTMYKKYPKGEITLWCDGRRDEEEDVSTSRKRRKRDGEGASRRQEKEEEVDDVFKQLKEKHGDKYDTPRLRLWSRSVCSKIHDDLEKPPDLPAFREEFGHKKARKESLTDALTGAAVAITNAFSSSHARSPPRTQGQPVGVSPGRSVELRMKNFEQLRFLQQLYDDGILTTTEFGEQKEKILCSLKKLN